MDCTLRIPFEHQNRKGVARFDYRQNPGPAESGLETIPGINFAFDLNLCKLYPTILATVEQYKGTGIRCSLAWIQFIRSRHWLRGQEDPQSGIGVDMAPVFGVPFYAYGYNPSLYDCPCYNLADDEERLEFAAETFLVTHPGRWNDNTVSFLAGARWGYVEYDADGKRKADILPIRQLNGKAWNAWLSLLSEQYPAWKYGEYAE